MTKSSYKHCSKNETVWNICFKTNTQKLYVRQKNSFFFGQLNFQIFLIPTFYNHLNKLLSWIKINLTSLLKFLKKTNLSILRFDYRHSSTDAVELTLGTSTYVTHFISAAIRDVSLPKTEQKSNMLQLPWAELIDPRVRYFCLKRKNRPHFRLRFGYAEKTGVRVKSKKTANPATISPLLEQNSVMCFGFVAHFWEFFKLLRYFCRVDDHENELYVAKNVTKIKWWSIFEVYVLGLIVQMATGTTEAIRRKTGK